MASARRASDRRTQGAGLRLMETSLASGPSGRGLGAFNFPKHVYVEASLYTDVVQTTWLQESNSFHHYHAKILEFFQHDMRSKHGMLLFSSFATAENRAFRASCENRVGLRASLPGPTTRFSHSSNPTWIPSRFIGFVLVKSETSAGSVTGDLGVSLWTQTLFQMQK